MKNYAEAAEWLGVPQKWLEQRVQQGKAPHTRLGKHVRFSQAHLEAIVKAGEPRATTVALPDMSLRPSPRGKRHARA